MGRPRIFELFWWLAAWPAAGYLYTLTPLVDLRASGVFARWGG